MSEQPPAPPPERPSQESLDFMRTHPGPGADDFDPNNHLWEGGEWWTKNREFWWDGARWRHRSDTVAGGIAPPAPGSPARPRDREGYWAGFFGTIAGNIVLIAIANGLQSAGLDPAVNGLVLALPWVLNFGLLILFAIVRPSVALGMLTAYGVGFALAILAGIFLLVLCFSGGGGVP